MRNAKPCPFYGMPCEYVALTEAFHAALRLAEPALAAELAMRNAAEDITDSGYAVPVAPALDAVRSALAMVEGH